MRRGGLIGLMIFKVGPEFAKSGQKANFDAAICRMVKPGVVAGELAVGRWIKKGDCPELHPIYIQERMGRGGELVTVHKFQTLKPGTEEYLGKWAKRLRTFGADELPQYYDVKAGRMSWFGYRHQTLEETESFFKDLKDYDQKNGTTLHDDTIAMRRMFLPGAVWPYSVHHHENPAMGPQESVHKARVELWAARHDSIPFEVGLLGELASLAVSGRMVDSGQKKPLEP